MAESISPERARRMGEEDAEIAIDIARERPLGAPDPDELYIADPEDYRDSPELPARRIATEWDDYLDDRLEEYAIELGIPEDEDATPHVLSRFGRAKTVFKRGDEEAWSAYQDGLADRLEDADVLLVQTIYTVYPVLDEIGTLSPDLDTNTYREIRSLYVADLTRFEPVPVPGYGDEGAVAEDHVQKGFVPRGEGRIRRWRRKRARRRAR
jgi:hypothetical protein